MNRGEAMGLDAIAGDVSIIIYYAILYFLVFDNFLVVMKYAGHDLYEVETELW